MKNFKVIFLVCSLFFLASCGGDAAKIQKCVDERTACEEKCYTALNSALTAYDKCLSDAVTKLNADLQKCMEKEGAEKDKCINDAIKAFNDALKKCNDDRKTAESTFAECMKACNTKYTDCIK